MATTILYPLSPLDDHSLVKLRSLPGQRRREYVNASYIDGFQRSRAYIGTQVKEGVKPTEL